MAKQVQTTIRQELFLRELMKTGVAAEAWRRVYKPKSFYGAQVSACRTLKKPHVRRRYNELLERQMKKSDITVDKVLADYQHALDLAKSQGKAADIVNAAQAQAKLVGLLRDKVEVGGVGDFQDINSVADILEIVGKEIGEEAAMVLAAAFNIPLEQEPEDRQSEKKLLIADPPSDAVN